jgi:hypothetical protein
MFAIICLYGCGGGGSTPVTPELNIENYTDIFIGSNLVAPRTETEIDLSEQNTITFQLKGNTVGTSFKSTIVKLDIRLVNLDRGVTLFVTNDNIDTLGNITVNPLGNQIIFTFNDHLDSIKLGGTTYYIDPSERLRVEVYDFDALYENGDRMHFGNNQSWFRVLNQP